MSGAVLSASKYLDGDQWVAGISVMPSTRRLMLAQNSWRVGALGKRQPMPTTARGVCLSFTVAEIILFSDGGGGEKGVTRPSLRRQPASATVLPCPRTCTPRWAGASARRARAWA